MAYQAIASDENTGASPLATAGATAAYPPGYETVDVESGFGSSRWFNYLYMETDSAVCQTFRIDTDLPPLPRRFANTEEQEKAANLFVNAGRTQAMVNLRGGPKAIIAIRGHHQRRRVMEIRREEGAETAFDLRVSEQGENATIVIPNDFEGTIVGPCELSPMLSERSVCVVYSTSGYQQNIVAVDPPPGFRRKAPLREGRDDQALSSVTISWARASKVRVCLSAEYSDEQREADGQQGDEGAETTEGAWWTHPTAILVSFVLAWGGIVTLIILLARSPKSEP